MNGEEAHPSHDVATPIQSLPSPPTSGAAPAILQPEARPRLSRKKGNRGYARDISNGKFNMEWESLAAFELWLWEMEQENVQFIIYNDRSMCYACFRVWRE